MVASNSCSTNSKTAPHERTLPDGMEGYPGFLTLAQPAGLRGRLQTRIRDSLLRIPLIVPELDGEDRIGGRAAMPIQRATPMSERFDAAWRKVVESTLPGGLRPYGISSKVCGLSIAVG